MSVSHLSPRFHSTPPAPRAENGVSLDVRVGSGRPVRYQITGTEFRVGGASACDLRLTTGNPPPLVCRVVGLPSGELQLYRDDLAFPILLNGVSVGQGPAALQHGDRVAVGSVDFTIHLGRVHLHPHLEATSAAAEPALIQQRDELLVECQQLRAEAQRLAAELPDLDARRAELEAFRDELSQVREQLHAQYQERRDQLAQMQEIVNGAAETLRARQDAFEQSVANRDAALAEQERRLAATPRPDFGRLEARAAELAESESRLVEHGELLAARESALQEHDAQLTQQTQALEQRELGCTAAEAEASARAAELAAREAELGARESELAQAATDLEHHTQSAAQEAARLQADRAALNASLDALTSQEAELAQARQAIEERDEALNRRAENLALAEAAVAEVEARHRAAAATGAELDAQVHALFERETALTQREGKLREVGKAVAGTKRDVATSRAELAAELERLIATRAEVTQTHRTVRAGLVELKAEWPALEQGANRAADALQARGTELARREAALEAATVEHRLAVAGFKAHVLAWQAEAEAAAEKQIQQQAIVPPPPPIEPSQLLAELRAWYQQRLQALVPENAPRVLVEPPDPGDRHLAELLRTHGLASAETAQGLLAAASQARRPLRAVLLASGVVTLYQLALIESGNLMALMLGRLRVLDRVRVTPREIVYRVSDPSREMGAEQGVFLLRHLSEAEMDDAVRPDEFRQRFAAAREAAHLHLARVVEVLELNGRPAALVEHPAGVPSGDWPADAANPGVWVRLVESAAAGLAAAHRHGLAHGRLSSESFVLTPSGELKVVGIGEPMWLSMGVAAALEPTPEADLRALGPVTFGWTQLAHPAGKRRTRGKAFPEVLLAVIRRLESDPDTPMADTAAGAVPYADAGELLADLARLAGQFPCPHADWDRLVSHAAAHARRDGLRQSA